jgi:hypothetical protein
VNKRAIFIVATTFSIEAPLVEEVALIVEVASVLEDVKAILIVIAW